MKFHIEYAPGKNERSNGPRRGHRDRARRPRAAAGRPARGGAACASLPPPPPLVRVPWQSAGTHSGRRPRFEGVRKSGNLLPAGQRAFASARRRPAPHSRARPSAASSTGQSAAGAGSSDRPRASSPLDASMAADGSFWARLRRDSATGVSVGLTDIALVYPLAVIATRRENGMTLRAALAARNLHSGGWTAGTLLVPYSVLVESMSQYLNSMSDSSSSSSNSEEGGGGGQLRMFAAAAATSLVASVGVQPIEKKLTMDQMLESGAAAKAVAARYPGAQNPLLTPLREIAAYTQAEGTAALFGGFLPL
jgi:hypothetical protein